VKYLARHNKHNRRNIGPHINLDNRHAFVIRATYMIVLDASTIILLGKINLLETFGLTFSGRVLISKKVRDEINIKETEENPLIVKLIEDEKIRVSKVNPVRNSEIVKFLVEIFCGPLVRTSSNIPMPLSA